MPDNLFVTAPMSQLIIQPFYRFTYVIVHSPTLALLHLRHCSFSNPYFASPTSQALHLIHLASRLWYFRRFTYVTGHYPTLPLLQLRQFVLQLFFRFSYAQALHLIHLASRLWYFRRFTYVTGHYPTVPLLHLRHSSFSNPSFASPTFQALHLIHLASRLWYFRRFTYVTAHSQPFRRFTYVTAQSPTLPSLHLRHRNFTYVTWRAAHDPFISTKQQVILPGNMLPERVEIMALKTGYSQREVADEFNQR